MTRKTVLAAALVIASAATATAGCRAHTGPVMSCADGTVYDHETKTCVAQSS